MAYTPGTPPQPNNETRNLTAFLMDELRRVQLIFNGVSILRLVEHRSPPARPRLGMVALADGTDWDPGAGQGVYAFFNGIWNKL